MVAAEEAEFSLGKSTVAGTEKVRQKILQRMRKME